MHDFVETWKAIASAMGRSERWCRYMAQRSTDPLPVFKVGGIVRMNLADRDAWLGTQRTQSMAMPRAAMTVTFAAADQALRLSA